MELCPRAPQGKDSFCQASSEFVFSEVRLLARPFDPRRLERAPRSDPEAAAWAAAWARVRAWHEEHPHGGLDALGLRWADELVDFLASWAFLGEVTQVSVPALSAPPSSRAPTGPTQPFLRTFGTHQNPYFHRYFIDFQ